MLTEITMTNFLSFKEKTVIDFRTSNYKILLDKNSTNGILKGAMFLGPNASGKSNVLAAIRALLDMLFSKSDINYKDYLCIFPSSPYMELSYNFAIQGEEITYYLRFPYGKNFGGIVEILTVNGDVILERDGVQCKSKISEQQNFYNIPDDNLILREIYFNTRFRTHKLLQSWFKFLSNSIYIDMYRNELAANRPSRFMVYEYFEKNGTEKINDFLERGNFGYQIEYVDKVSNGQINILSDDGKAIFIMRDGLNIPIPFEMESIGNKNLIKLIPVFLHVIENKGMLLIDEFGSGFHNKLEELLIKYFMESTKLSQMFFVSHSTNLMNNSIMRPDQLYLVKFDCVHGSIIERISKYQPREAQNVEKMYLGGVFDGLPEYKLPTQ